MTPISITITLNIHVDPKSGQVQVYQEPYEPVDCHDYGPGPYGPRPSPRVERPLTSHEDASTMETLDLDGGAQPALPPSIATLAEERTHSRVMEAQERFDQRILDGEAALTDLLRSWMINYGVEQKEGEAPVDQPPRVQILQRLSATKNTATMAFIASRRGLRAAVYYCLLKLALINADEAGKKLADDVAGNIVQIASVNGLPIAETIEYTPEDNRYE